MKQVYDLVTGYHRFYGVREGTCMFDDQPAQTGYVEACTVIEDDREYVIRMDFNVCFDCYVKTSKSQINRLFKKKRLEIVKNGQHIHSLS